MKKLSALFLSFAIFGSLNAQADLSGTWIGWADWYFDGSGTRCPIAKLKFTEDSKQLTRVSGSVDCEFVFMDYQELAMLKKGGELWVDDQKVGTFSDNNYAWTEIYSPTVRIEVTAKREAGHLDYVEHWINNEGILIYDIRSRVFTSGQ
ncbi:MAG: hypothetical protein ACXWC9_01430 [Pseudobdellovibrionaceae bacterium]